jgi:hypothetical protein
MLNRLIDRFRKKTEPPPLRGPTFGQIEPARSPRLLIPSLVAIGASLGAYLAWPEQKPRVAPAAAGAPLVPGRTAAIAPEMPAAQILDRREEIATRPHVAATPALPKKKKIYTGPRGGRYHFSASGKKVYERKRR